MKSRRDFLKQSAILFACAGSGRFYPDPAFADEKSGKMKLGLVTYQWGMDWGVPTLIANCEKARLSGVELRAEHAHNVTPNLSSEERKTIAKRFANSAVKLVGFGSIFEYHSPDQDTLRKNIEGTKEYVLLSKDCGASGVKVRPNALPKEVETEKTIAQIARSLSEVGRFAAEHGQEIRLEVHGGCAQIPVIKAIIDQVPEKNVGLCWNCNSQDLEGPGLKENFKSVRTRLSQVIHIRDLASKSYPTKDLFDLLQIENYAGYLLIEEGDATLSADERIRRMRQSAEILNEWQK
jgi:sugar phosphate isomerase/epimerase